MDWIGILRGLLNGGNRMSVMQYLQTEIKPDIIRLQDRNIELSEKVAALPTRKEFTDTFDKIHRRIDTKQDKQP